MHFDDIHPSSQIFPDPPHPDSQLLVLPPPFIFLSLSQVTFPSNLVCIGQLHGCGVCSRVPSIHQGHVTKESDSPSPSN